MMFSKSPKVKNPYIVIAEKGLRRESSTSIYSKNVENAFSAIFVANFFLILYSLICIYCSNYFVYIPLWKYRTFKKLLKLALLVIFESMSKAKSVTPTGCDNVTCVSVE